MAMIPIPAKNGIITPLVRGLVQGGLRLLLQDHVPPLSLSRPRVLDPAQGYGAEQGGVLALHSAHYRQHETLPDATRTGGILQQNNLCSFAKLLCTSCEASNYSCTSRSITMYLNYYRVSHPIVHRDFSAKMGYFATGWWAGSAATYCPSGFSQRP